MIKYRIINAVALIGSFIPALVAVFQYYPAIVDVTESVFDRIGIGVVIGAVIVFAFVTRYLHVKSPSPSPDILFAALWIVSELLKKVIVPMSTIFFWAAIGAVVGRAVLAISAFYERREMRRLNKANGGE